MKTTRLAVPAIPTRIFHRAVSPAPSAGAAVAGNLLALLLFATPGTSRADNLFVASPTYGTIEEFNSSGVGTTFASGLSGLGVLAFDNAGNLYATVGSGIEKFNSSGIGTVFASSGVSAPTGMAFDSAGNLFVANNGNQTIEEFSSLGVGSVYASLGAVATYGLACDSTGNLYVPTGNDNQIEEFNPSLGTWSSFASGLPLLDYPANLTFDSAGSLYVVNINSANIAKFNSSGGGSVFASFGATVPWGLACDSADNLYTVVGNTIEEFNSSGVGMNFASLEPTYHPALAFQPVPEPSTWALLAGGLVALVSVKRRLA
ncbi:MAG: PEP-CTERM sorting domain-containing protein [Limisphaerales bacterium]